MDCPIAELDRTDSKRSTPILTPFQDVREEDRRDEVVPSSRISDADAKGDARRIEIKISFSGPPNNRKEPDQGTELEAIMTKPGDGYFCVLRGNNRTDNLIERGPSNPQIWSGSSPTVTMHTSDLIGRRRKLVIL
jgi:hypothetical protein